MALSAIQLNKNEVSWEIAIVGLVTDNSIEKIQGLQMKLKTSVEPYMLDIIWIAFLSLPYNKL